MRPRGIGAIGFWRVVGGLAGAVAGACGPSGPYVRYDGIAFGRPAKPVEAMEVFRFGVPSGRFQDLGTVSVSCPSFGGAQQFGGCDYGWAVGQASTRAASNGGDGIHGIETAVNTAGRVVSLRASVFVRLPPLVGARPASEPVVEKPVVEKPVVETRKPTVEERLRQLDKLKQDGLINQDEYQQKRRQILSDI